MSIIYQVLSSYRAFYGSDRVKTHFLPLFAPTASNKPRTATRFLRNLSHRGNLSLSPEEAPCRQRGGAEDL